MGSLIVYAGGVPWLKAVTGMAWSKTFAVGMYPFIIGDILKIAAGAFAAKIIRPVIQDLPLKSSKGFVNKNV